VDPYCAVSSGFKEAWYVVPVVLLHHMLLVVGGVSYWYRRGWVANTLKVVPQNAIRLVSYETLKKLLQVQKSKTDT